MAVVEAIRECRPRVVVAPYPRDRHPDHAAAGRLAREACFLARVRNVGTEEPHTVTRLHHYMLHEPFAPSFVLDITSVWERKLAAILAYQSQFGSGDGAQTQISAPSFPRMLEARAIYHGSMVGAAWGEAYHHLGPIGMDQLPEGPSSPEHYNMFS
jgi:LmbE family N-acetylglucosaminyl deacetylase